MASEKVTTIEVDGKPVEISVSALRRIVMGRKLAARRMELIRTVHRTDKGQKVDEDSNPQWKAIWADGHPDQRVMSSAQVGKSLLILLTLIAGADCGLETGYVAPTDHKRNEFVKNRVDRTFRHTPYYDECMRLGGGVDSMKEKQWAALDGTTSAIHFATAASDQELIAFSADVMCIDERDRCDRNNLRLYPSRMERSKFRITLEATTPTYPGFRPKPGQTAPDNIHTEFMTGDQRKWFVACQRCGFYQVPAWETHFVKLETDDAGRIIDFGVRDQDWSPGSMRDVRAVCESCGYPFDPTHHDAHWRAMAPWNGGVANIRSWWVNRLCADIGKPRAEILDRFGKAITNPTLMQQVYNMDLGIPYAGGFVGFRLEVFNRCAHPDPYPMLDRWERSGTTAGIDVNVPFYDVQISAWDKSNLVRPQMKLYAGKVQGRENLYALLRKYNVKYAVIDQQPEMNAVVEMQAEMPRLLGCHVTRAHYSTHELKEPIVVSEASERAYGVPIRITLDRTSTIDRLYSSMLERRVRWFSNFAEIEDGAVIGEMTRPVRVKVESPTGGERFAWTGEPNHQLMAANFDLIAGHFGHIGITQYTDPVIVKVDYSQDNSARALPGAMSPEQQLDRHAKAVGLDPASVAKRKKNKSTIMIFRG